MHGVPAGPQLVGERAHPVGESLHVVEQHDLGHLYTPLVIERRSHRMIQDSRMIEICRSMMQVPDYDLDDMLVVTAPAQLRALADPLRATLLELLLERAATVTEMAQAVGRPKSTVAYHVNLLVDAGLLQVVRTRRVRAIEERYYGRVARTLYIGVLNRPEDKQVAAAVNGLAEAAAESAAGARGRRAAVPARARPHPGRGGAQLLGARSRRSPAGSPRSPGPATRSTASPRASTPPTPPPCPTPSRAT